MFPIYVTSCPTTDHTAAVIYIFGLKFKTAATNYRANLPHNMDFQKLSDNLCVFNNFKTQTPQGLWG